MDLLKDCRLALKDVGVKATADSMLISSANEAKDEIVQIIRQARQDYFITFTTTTVTPANPPFPSTVTLPVDFMLLKDLACNDAGYEGLVFIPLDQTDPRFRRALIDGGSYSAGNALCYYDIQGSSQLLLAPGFDLSLNLTIWYIKTVKDMVALTDEPEGIPSEYCHYIMAHMVCDALRMAASPALAAWETHLAEKKIFMMQNMSPRQVKDPVFVRGFGEDECW